MLAKFADIEAGVLRQRRDLYAVSIALAIFHLAGGNLTDQASQSVLQFRLDRPWVLVISAWVGFAYFLYRYWLLAPSWSEIASRLRTESGLQARATDTFHKLAIANLRTNGRDHGQAEVVRAAIERREYLPSYTDNTGGVQLHYAGLPNLTETATMSSHVAGSVHLSEADVALLQNARRQGRFRAITRERTFTDYLLPYVFAGATAIIGIADGVSRYREPSPPPVAFNVGA